MDKAQRVAERELEGLYVHSVHKGDGEAGRKQLEGLSPFPRWERLEIGGLRRITGVAGICNGQRNDKCC